MFRWDGGQCTGYTEGIPVNIARCAGAGSVVLYSVDVQAKSECKIPCFVVEELSCGVVLCGREGSSEYRRIEITFHMWPSHNFCSVITINHTPLSNVFKHSSIRFRQSTHEMIIFYLIYTIFKIISPSRQYNSTIFNVNQHHLHLQMFPTIVNAFRQV